MKNKHLADRLFFIGLGGIILVMLSYSVSAPVAKFTYLALVVGLLGIVSSTVLMYKTKDLDGKTTGRAHGATVVSSLKTYSITNAVVVLIAVALFLYIPKYEYYYMIPAFIVLILNWFRNH